MYAPQALQVASTLSLPGLTNDNGQSSAGSFKKTAAEQKRTIFQWETVKLRECDKPHCI